MNRIFKYKLDIHHAQDVIAMPKGAQVRRFSMQGETPCIWAQVEDENKAEPRTFQIVGTGHEIPLRSNYVGSCDDRQFVWHLFELV